MDKRKIIIMIDNRIVAYRQRIAGAIMSGEWFEVATLSERVKALESLRDDVEACS